MRLPLILALLLALAASARDYPATCTAAYDGDTITVDIDLGLGVVLKGQRIRLHGLDAPEMTGAEKTQGIIVRDYVRGRILNKPVILRTLVNSKGVDRRGKYGRWLGIILYWPDEDRGAITNLNELLLKTGMAAEYLKD